MLSYRNTRQKRILINAFSNCFHAIKDELGNVPLSMQKSHEIAGSIVGTCRGFAIINRIKESNFELMIEAVFSELFRRESLQVQARAQQWLRTEDETFMLAYYHSKSKVLNSSSFDLTWLSDYAKKHFAASKRQLRHRQTAYR